MKRDMDLVREILAEAAAASAPLDACALTGPARDLDLVGYHIEIMCEAGLIHGSVEREMRGHVCGASVLRLTWAGNDFLDSIADDRVWSRVKRSIARTAGSAAFETVRALAVRFSAELIAGA